MQILIATVPVSERAAYALSWTLLHSLWQGAILALLVGLLLLFWRKQTANFRYHLFTGMLLFFVVWVGFTFSAEWRHYSGILSRVNSPLPDFSAEPLTRGSETLSTPPYSQNWPSSLFVLFIQYFEQNKSLILLFWGGVMLFKSIKMALGIGYTYALRNRKVFQLPAHIQQRFQALSIKMGLAKKIQCLESALVPGPVTFGFFRPLILLPFGLINQLPLEQVEAILLHELAHVRRSDYLINLLQCFLENLFFFNPALLWVSYRIRQERENCCDELAIQVLADKTLYLKALVEFQSYSMREIQYGQAFWGSKMHLLDRVKRILNRDDYQILNITEKISLMLGLMLLGAVLLWAVPHTSPEKTSLEPISQPLGLAQETGSGQILSKQKATDKKVEAPFILQPLNKTPTLQHVERITEPTFLEKDTIPSGQNQLDQLQADLALAKRQYEQEQAKYDSIKAYVDQTVKQLKFKAFQRIQEERVKSHDLVGEMLIDDLIADGIIKNKGQLRSYSLYNNTFTVNGRKQTTALMQTYQQKYLQNKTTGNVTGWSVHKRTTSFQREDKSMH